MTELQTAQTGTYAAQVLDNQAYKDAMASLKAQVIQQWKDCPIRDKEGQMLLLQLAKLTDKFDGILSGMVAAGVESKRRIDLDNLRDESKPRKALRRVFG